MKNPLAPHLKMAATTLDTIDQLFALNDLNADAKAHHLITVALPGVVAHLSERARGPGAARALAELEALIHEGMAEIAKKHSMRLEAKVVDLSPRTNTDDWKISP